jgi:prophage regulatory protein
MRRNSRIWQRKPKGELMESRSRRLGPLSGRGVDSVADETDAPREAGEAQHRGRLEAAPPLRMLRFPAVRERTGLSRSTIWRLEQRGSFPRHRRISANAVAWLEEDVVAWIRCKFRA